MPEPTPPEGWPDLPGWQRSSAVTHLLVSFGVGLLLGVPMGLAFGWTVGGFAGWLVSAAVFLGWTWAAIWPMDARSTARFAQREDPSRPLRDLVLLVGAVVSVLAVALVIFRAQESGPVSLTIGVASIVASWSAVHTVFTLAYARHYYSDPIGGIDFNQAGSPSYRDFAYLAFTVGMTFQVSDTAVASPLIRTSVLRHALISFVFGTVIIAVTINLVAGLGR